MEQWPRWRLYLVYYGAIVLTALVLISAYAGLVVLGSVHLALRVLTTLVIIGVFLTVAYWIFLISEEIVDDDWGNDFKNENRVLIGSGVYLIGTLAIGVLAGCWLAS